MKLSEVIPNLIEHIKINHNRLPDAVNQIILFGSYARGAQRVGSDVDIAVAGEHIWETEPRCKVRDVFDDFDETVEISLFFTTTDKINEVESKFDANYSIREEGVLLWER